MKKLFQELTAFYIQNSKVFLDAIKHYLCSWSINGLVWDNFTHKWIISNQYERYIERQIVEMELVNNSSAEKVLKYLWGLLGCLSFDFGQIERLWNLWWTRNSSSNPQTFSALIVCTWTSQFVKPALITLGPPLRASWRFLTQIVVVQGEVHLCVQIEPWRAYTGGCVLDTCLIFPYILFLLLHYALSFKIRPLHEYTVWNLVSLFKYLNLGKFYRDKIF